MLQWWRSYLEPALRISWCLSTGRGSLCSASYWKGNCHRVVVFVGVCLCRWHCVVVLRHGTTKSSSIAMLLMFKPTCWCYLGIEMGLEIMLVLCCQLNIRCGNRTAKWFLQMTQRTLSVSFMMKLSLLIMVTLRTGISVFTKINFHGSKIIKILLQL